MVGEVADLGGKRALGVGVSLQVDVGVTVQVEGWQPVDVLAKQRLLRLVQVEYLRNTCRTLSCQILLSAQ